MNMTDQTKPKPAKSWLAKERELQNKKIEDFLVASADRNKIPQSTFCRYMPLYSKTPNYSEAQLSELATEYRVQVNPYEPVTVYDDHTKEVLFTLPPSLNRVASIHPVVAMESEVLERYAKVFSDPNMPPRKQAQAADQLMQVYDISQKLAAPERAEELAKHKALTEALTQPKTDNTKPTVTTATPAADTSDWEWE
jgi:hypothetical protein